MARKQTFSLASYNRFLGASMRKNHFSRKEAAEQYRALRDHFKRSVTANDLRTHPKVSKQEASRIAANRTGKGFESIAPSVPIQQLPARQPEEFVDEPPEDLEFDSSEDFEGDYGEA